MSLSSEDLKAIESLLEPIKRDIQSIQLTLETQTNRDIKMIAEGHFDLCRTPDESLTIANEKKRLLTQVNILEAELREAKKRIENMA